jgi:hypothetical protein
MHMTSMFKQYKYMRDIYVYCIQTYEIIDFTQQLLPNHDPWNLWCTYVPRLHTYLLTLHKYLPI